MRIEYGPNGQLVGGLGVSGDTSCTDHAGDATHPDNIIFDITPNPNGGTGISASGFGHPTCYRNPDNTSLPAVEP